MRTSRIVAAIAAFASSGCYCSPTVSMSSGSPADGDIEEPLAEAAKKYEPLLHRANELAAMLRDGKVEQVYSVGLADSLKQEISQAEFAKLVSDLVVKMGPVKGFKPMQWAFTTGADRGRAFVSCTKIVEHERGKVHYVFTFADERATKLIGFHYRQRRTKALGIKTGPTASP